MSSKLPNPLRGVYLLCADVLQPDIVTTIDGKQAIVKDNPNWQPKCGDWIKQFNVVYLTFLQPDAIVPPAMVNAAKNRGPNGLNLAEGTKVLYSIGGYAYCNKPPKVPIDFIAKWAWLDNKDTAEKMAEQIAADENYKYVDGFDFDIEPDDAQTAAGPCLKPGIVHFVRKLRELKPDWIITQPVLGNATTYQNPLGVGVALSVCWPSQNWFNGGNKLPDGVVPMKTDKGLYDGLTLMGYGYSVEENITFRDGYGKPGQCKAWCPVPCDIPHNLVTVGVYPNKGAGTQDGINQLLDLTSKGELQGYMVWYASADNGFQYKDRTGAATIDVRNNLGINYRGSKGDIKKYRCKTPGKGCEEDLTCSESSADCFSTIGECNLSKKCGPFYACLNRSTGCEMDKNCSGPTEDCFSTIEDCNTKKNCQPLYACKTKGSGCEISDACTSIGSGCYAQKDTCDSSENCSSVQPNVCKWYQTGTWPNCVNPSCKSVQQLESFEAVKKSKFSKILFLVVLVSLGLLGVLTSKNLNVLQISAIVFVLILVIQ